MKQKLVGMFHEALRSLDVAAHMRAHFARLGDLSAYAEVKVVAIGKASATMADAMSKHIDSLLGSGRARGIVVGPVMPQVQLPNFRYFVGGHPYPNQGSFDAARAVLEFVRGGADAPKMASTKASTMAAAKPGPLVVFLISGGGSALFEAPLIPLADCQRLYEALVTCGANIYEMNVVRKHFSSVKGGQLAAAAYPARQITMFVSDVPAGKDSTVASGPTMPDESTSEGCRAIVEKFHLPVVLDAMRETPKPGDRVFERSTYVNVLSNPDGIDALLAQARAAGWSAIADTSCDDWPLSQAAEYLIAKLKSMPRPACVISGGELSCPVTGGGRGGRNQAFVLDCAIRIAGQRIAVLSAGTDGADGNSPAAGAVADGETVARAASPLDPSDFFARSDSYTFFDRLGDTIVTGPTGNNVRDLRILLSY